MSDGHRMLRRQLGLWRSVFVGLGSIVGTGVFVSIGLAAGVAGPAVIVSIALAALVAACNGLSSAELAANYPVSGGTYEYGYRTLRPVLGFSAGWLFLAAKSASAATAALGFAGYLLNALDAEPGGALVPVALGAVALLVAVVLGGIQRSSSLNAVIVSVTLLALLFFVVAGALSIEETGWGNLTPFFGAGEQGGVAGVLHAAALMFVAYTGYGRIATLGEEVRDPARTIPRAIVVTLILTMFLYVSVGTVGVVVAGARGLYEATQQRAAPLEVVSQSFSVAGASLVLAVGAVTAMLGVLLNLVLGLSRVLLAMGRRRDMPAAVARLDRRGVTPYVAVLVVGAIIAGLVLIGDVRVTWSFSAFTVLIYYALTNLAALRLDAQRRLFPQIVPILGLVGCLSLAFWVERTIWLVGLGVIGVGLAWHLVAARLRGAGRAPEPEAEAPGK